MPSAASITGKGRAGFIAVLVQILVLDIVFSFVKRHPSVKILALSEDQEEAAAQEDQVPPGRRPGTTHDQLSPQTYPEWT